MASRYEVPITIDGKTLQFPVDDAESPEQAAEMVNAALKSGELDEMIGVALNYKRSKVRPEDQLRAKALMSIPVGLKNAGFNATEFSLLLKEQAAGALGGPEAEASVRAELNQVRNKRRQVDAWEKKAFENVLGTGAEPGIVGKAAGEMLFFGPLAKVGSGTTFLRSLLGNVTAGAGEGAIMSAQDAEKLADTAGGATIGGIAGTASSAFNMRNGARAFMGRKFAEELDTDIAREGLALEKELQELTNGEFKGFTISQIGGQNPWLIGLERGAIGKASLLKQNENVQALANLVMKRGEGMSPEQFVTDLHGSMTKTLSDMQDIASSNYKRGMEAVMGAYGDEIVVDGRKYLDDLRMIRGELADPRRIGAKAHAALAKHEAFVAKRIEEHGGLTAEDFNEILKGHNEMLGGNTSISALAAPGSSEQIAKYLKASMLGSLDGQSSPAVQSIRSIMKGYLTDMNKVRAIEDTFLGRIFDVAPDKVTALRSNPDAALSRLANLSPAGLKNAKEIITQTAPQLMEDMKRLVMARAVEESVDTSKSIGMNIVDPRTLARALAGPKGTSLSQKVGGRGLGLLDATEQREIVAAAEALRHMSTTVTTDIGKDTVGIAADATINTISHSKEFFARWIVRFAGKSKNIEDLLINPQSRKALLALAKAGPGSIESRLALTWLTAYGVDMEKQREKESLETAARLARKTK